MTAALGPSPTQRRTMTVALVGRPNVGKTSLLMHLTGTPQRPVNFPGTSVERTESTVVVDATASTDNRLTEVPASVALFVDGSVTATDTQPCVPLANDCSLALTWDATGLTGSHTLRTTVTTTAGQRIFA